MWLRDDMHDQGRRFNLTNTAQRYLERLRLGVEDLFHHVLATLHDPAYREDNVGALRMEWPRVPLPSWPDGGEASAAAVLAESAARGRKIAALLDPEAPVPGVTQAPPRPDLVAIAVPSTVDGRNLADDDFALTAKWGRVGTGAVVIPGKGRVTERTCTPEEYEVLGTTFTSLNETTFDVWLNDRAFWRNVPAAVWHYRLGGYQVLKKWLSYREQDILGRALYPNEIAYFSDTARRIAAILRLTEPRD